MEYYLIDTEQPEAYLTIGTDNGFGVFWSDQGLEALTKIVNDFPEKITEMQIKNDSNHTLTISEFMQKLDKLKVR